MDPANPLVGRLPTLDGSNYAYWKTRSRAYIKSIDARAWKAILNGYNVPMNPPDNDGDTTPKPESEWTQEENNLATFNDKALNVIFGCVDLYMFKLIQNCSTAKDAWDTLQAHCEGNDSVRKTKLRMLKGQFENLRMKESEDVSTYFEKILDISNECHNLGEPMSNLCLVEKALRTLTRKYNQKTLIIEDTKQIATLDFNDLMNMLKTFELNMASQDEFYDGKHVGKSVAFQTQSSEAHAEDEDEVFEEIGEGVNIALITRKYNSMVRKFNKQNIQLKAKEQRTSFVDQTPKRTSPSGSFSKRSPQDRGNSDPKNLDSIQCHACSGWGHYAKECANTLRKKGLSFLASLSDDENEQVGTEDNEEPVVKAMFINVTGESGNVAENVIANVATNVAENVTGNVAENVTTSEATFGITSHPVRSDFFEYSNTYCFHGSVAINADNDHDEEITNEDMIRELQSFGETLLKEVNKLTMKSEALSKEKDMLNDTINRLEVLLTRKDDENAKLRSKLNLAEATFKKLNTGTKNLNDVLNVGKTNKSGLGFQNSFSNLTSFIFDKTPSTVFIKEKEKEPKIEDFVENKNEKPFFEQVNLILCEFCKRPGHTKPFCLKFLKKFGSEKMLPKMSCDISDDISGQNHKSVKKQVWVPKTGFKSYVVYTAFKTSTDGAWYFDSGCSRHMTGSEEHLKEYEALRGSSVTYGDGAQGKIIGRGVLNVPGFPELKNVLHVDGLKANLISISQLCDDDLEVRFNKYACRVYNESNLCVMTGKRSRDNCYLAGVQEICHKTCVDESIMWHKKLGHTNFRNLEKLVKIEAVRGLPKIKVEEKIVCEDCLKGKQTRVTHNVVQHFEQHSGTNHCFQLLHMDLIGPVEVDSLGGMRYVFVIVDDFSRYTWVYFLKEKSQTFENFKTLHASIRNLFASPIFRIRSDHGREFENSSFKTGQNSKNTR